VGETKLQTGRNRTCRGSQFRVKTHTGGREREREVAKQTGGLLDRREDLLEI